MEQIYTLPGRPLRVVFDWSNGFKRFFDPAGHAWAFVGEQQDMAEPVKRRGEKHGR